MFKVNSKDTSTTPPTDVVLTPERYRWRSVGVFIVSFELF